LTELTEFTELTEKKYDLAGDVIGAAMKVHRALGPGYLETVHVNALAHELAKAKIDASLQAPVQVRYDGIVVGNYIADFIVAETLIVEVKAVQSLVPAHEAQLVNYLTTTGIEIGLLLNFGSTSLEFRRTSRQYRPPNSVNFVNSV
jgi:GxxExxY protein